MVTELASPSPRIVEVRRGKRGSRLITGASNRPMPSVYPTIHPSIHPSGADMTRHHVKKTCCHIEAVRVLLQVEQIGICLSVTRSEYQSHPHVLLCDCMCVCACVIQRNHFWAVQMQTSQVTRVGGRRVPIDTFMLGRLVGNS